MKICIPSQNDEGLESAVFDHFGTAPYFTIVDTESGEVDVLPNPDCHQNEHQCHHTGHLRSRSVDAVVSSGIGRRALIGLRESGIKVLASDADRVGDAVNEVKAGNAAALSEDQACGGGHHGTGGGGSHGRCGGHGHHHRHASHHGAGTHDPGAPKPRNG